MDAIGILKSCESDVKARFHLKRIGVFGSFARGEERAGSDVDVLVEFEPDHVTFDNYADLKFHIEELFGREVDLVTEDAIRPQMKDSILGETTYA